MWKIQNESWKRQYEVIRSHRDRIGRIGCAGLGRHAGITVEERYQGVQREHDGTGVD